MKKNRFMVIGAVGAGKTSLVKAILGKTDVPSKTQSIEYNANTIDTPGEYVENPMFYRALFATSLEADVIIFVQDATKETCVFPPGFASAFSKPVIGVVSKIDHPEANVENALKILNGLGLKGKTQTVSALTGEGIAELEQMLKKV